MSAVRFFQAPLDPGDCQAGVELGTELNNPDAWAKLYYLWVWCRRWNMSHTFRGEKAVTVVEGIARWRGKRGAFVAACLKTGWMEDANGALRVKPWQEVAQGDWLPEMSAEEPSSFAAAPIEQPAASAANDDAETRREAWRVQKKEQRRRNKTEKAPAPADGHSTDVRTDVSAMSAPNVRDVRSGQMDMSADVRPVSTGQMGEKEGENSTQTKTETKTETHTNARPHSASAADPVCVSPAPSTGTAPPASLRPVETPAEGATAGTAPARPGSPAREPAGPRKPVTSASVEFRGNPNIPEGTFWPPEVAKVFCAWAKLFCPAAKLDHEAARLVTRALNFSYSVDELVESLQGWTFKPWVMQDTESRARLETLLGSSTKVGEGLGLYRKHHRSGNGSGGGSAPPAVVIPPKLTPEQVAEKAKGRIRPKFEEAEATP